jgi:hypothetical protein
VAERTPPGALLEGGEAGTGAIGTLAGFGAFLGFLLLAVQLLVHLYATSVVTSAAYDAARLASGTAVSPAAAEAHGRSLLGGFNDRTPTFSVVDAGDHVRVRVEASSPALLPATFGSIAGISSISREVVARKEQLVDAP